MIQAERPCRAHFLSVLILPAVVLLNVPTRSPIASLAITLILLAFGITAASTTTPAMAAPANSGSDMNATRREVLAYPADPFGKRILAHSKRNSN